MYEHLPEVNLVQGFYRGAVVTKAVEGAMFAVHAARADDPMLPVDPERFERDLAGALNALMADAAARERMGRAGRVRAVEHFSWGAIARQTADLYRRLIEG